MSHTTTPRSPITPNHMAVPPPNSLRPAQLSLARLHERLAINPWRRILLGTLAGLSVTSLMLALALWSTRVVSSLLGLAAGGIVGFLLLSAPLVGMAIQRNMASDMAAVRRLLAEALVPLVGRITC